MAQRTIAHMYDRYDDARSVVTELEGAGIPHGDISLVANPDARGTSGTGTAGTGTTGETAVDPAVTGSSAAGTSGGGSGAGAGAVLGTAVGGGVGLLAGIGALAIPGVGPVVAAGWLIATLTGAGIGAASLGLVGALTGAGLSKDEADVYAHGVKTGGSLVTVRVDEGDATRVESLMGRFSPVDWRQRRASLGPDWNESDDAAATRLSPSGAAEGADLSAPGAGGSYAPGTDPGRRL